MKGKLKILYYIEEMGTAIPLRPYVAMVLLGKGLPLTIAAWIAGLNSTEEFVSMMAQLHDVKKLADLAEEPVKVPIHVESDDQLAVQDGSLRERFIEYIQSSAREN